MRSKSPASDYLGIKSWSPNILQKLNHSNYLRNMNCSNFLPKVVQASRCQALPRDPWFPMISHCISTWPNSVNISGSTEFLQNLRLRLVDLSRRQKQDPSTDVAKYVLYRLKQLASHLSRITDNVPGKYVLVITSIYRRTQNTILESVGRPRFEISKDQLEYFVEYELACPDIAEALDVSASTIKRRTV